MNAEAIVHHGEMPQAFGVKTNDGHHHVEGIQRVNEISDDAVGLLSCVNVPCFILYIYKERLIRAAEALGLLFPDRMNHRKARRCGPYHAAIHRRQSASKTTQPRHEVARFHGDFGNRFFEDLRQVLGAFLRIFAGLYELFLQQLFVNRSPRDAMWRRHRRVFDIITIDLSAQLPGGLAMLFVFGMFCVPFHTPAHQIGDLLVNILWLFHRNEVCGVSAHRIQTPRLFCLGEFFEEAVQAFPQFLHRFIQARFDFPIFLFEASKVLGINLNQGSQISMLLVYTTRILVEPARVDLDLFIHAFTRQDQFRDHVMMVFVKFLELCQSGVKIRPMLNHELKRPVHFFECHAFPLII